MFFAVVGSRCAHVHDAPPAYALPWRDVDTNRIEVYRAAVGITGHVDLDVAGNDGGTRPRRQKGAVEGRLPDNLRRVTGLRSAWSTSLLGSGSVGCR